MMVLFRVLVFTFLAVFVAETASAQYKDDDWSLGLFNSCQPPCDIFNATPDRPASFDWITGPNGKAMQVSLLPGDVGGCRSDTSPRHGAPFWERAELTQYGHLEAGLRHEISFDAQFDKGFAGKKETFFQIHGWTKSCPSAPLLMLQFDWRHLKARVLKVTDPEEMDLAFPRGDLVSMLENPPHLDEMRNRVNNFHVIFDRTQITPTLEIHVNGVSLMPPTQVHMVKCAEPKMKIGIYRPGAINPAPSRLIFDRLMHNHGGEGTCTLASAEGLGN